MAIKLEVGKALMAWPLVEEFFILAASLKEGVKKLYTRRP